MRLVPGRVPGDEAGGVVPHHGRPAGAVAATGSARVPAQPGDVGPGVAAGGEAGAPGAPARRAPDLEAGRVERAGEEAASVERVADGAGAVIATRGERAVSPTPDVGKVVDLVGGLDHPTNRKRCVRRRDRVAVRVDRRVAGGRR